MDSKKLLSFIVLALLVGFGIEFLKGMDGLNAHKRPKFSQLDMSDMDTRPYHVKVEDGEELGGRQATRVGKGFSLAAYGEFKGGHDFGKDGKSARGKKVADKDKNKDKKKKKKKKSAQAKRPKKSSEPKIYEENKPKKSNDDSGSSDVAYTGGQVPATQNQEESKYDEWAKQLLVRPDRDAVVNFIREYQGGKVTAADFYAIVEAMYKEEILEFKSLAVLAAGATPSLRSFNFLVKAYSSESSGSSLQAQAQSELRDYSSLQYLWIPKGILSGAKTLDLSAALISASAMDIATTHYLVDRAAASDDSGQSDDVSNARSQNTTIRTIQLQYFSGLIPTLEKAIETYKSEQAILAPLEAALSRIRQAGLVAYNEPQ